MIHSLAGAAAPLLDIQDLHVAFRGPSGWREAVSGLNLRVDAGETVALVGESGCGKSTTALALLRLLAPGSRTQGRVLFGGRDVAALPDAEFRRLRGGEIAMVAQACCDGMSDRAFGISMTGTLRPGLNGAADPAALTGCCTLKP